MTKAELRQQYKAKRQTLSTDTIDTQSLAIANQLLKLDIWSFEYYHLFLSIETKKEINTECILNILSGKDKYIVISKTDFATRGMTHYLLTDATVIKKNSYGIPEPQDGIEIPSSKIEVVFVPLLAFDKIGHRVGYGKGFYDSFLASCHENTLKIGLSFFESEEVIQDIHKNDIKLDYCVTPNCVYKF